MSCCVPYNNSPFCVRIPPVKMMTSVNLPTSEQKFPSETHSRMPPGYLLWVGLVRKQPTNLLTPSSFLSFVLTCTYNRLPWSKVSRYHTHTHTHTSGAVSALPSISAILFWLNCKSVYSYWQHQRKMLNDEVYTVNVHM